MEEVVQFGEGLVGILGVPDGRAAAGPVLFLNGAAGNCAGPHRLLAEWARALARNGIPSLRFDYHGRGDSPGAEREQDLLAMSADAIRARAYIEERLGRPPESLVAICSGSLVALHCLRSVGARHLVFLSPDREQDLGLVPVLELGARHLPAYLRKLGRTATWRRILGGEIHWRVILLDVLRLRALWRPLTRKRGRAESRGAASGFPSLYWSHFLEHHRGGLQLWLGELDPLARRSEHEFRSASGEYGLDLDLRKVPGADALFSSIDAQRMLISESIAWLLRCSGGERPTPPVRRPM